MYPVQICELKTKDCAGSGSFQQTKAPLFSTFVFASFHKHTPLLPMTAKHYLYLHIKILK